MGQLEHKPPVKLAVFDFDGTSISGNSPVLLVGHLIRHCMLRPTVSLRIGFWAFAYKFRLPQNESWVRSLVFTAFEGKPQREVDDYLMKFYDEVIAPRFRPQADKAMENLQEQGCEVMVVSATWEPIVVRAMQFHPFTCQLSTSMKIDEQGCYTREVDGIPVEGEEKIKVVKRWADARYGEGNWTLEHAFGDHHSDRPLLDAAHFAHAVTPDAPLARTAKENGWEVLDWD